MVDLRDVAVVVDGTTLLPRTSVAVGRGQAVVVRGHNGAGKSTLLRVVAGMRTPTSGSATVGGERISKRDATFRRRLAAMIGLPPMAPDLTIRDHVRMVSATWFSDPDEAEAVAAETIGSLDLQRLDRRFPHELSTGQLQVAALAVVLARPFDVLVLDEPEQRLDQDRLAGVRDVLAARRDAGAALVIATHSTTLADSLADHVVDLDADGSR